MDNDSEGATDSVAAMGTAAPETSNERARLENSVGQVLIRVSRPREALTHFQTARRMASSSSERTKLQNRIAAIQAWLHIQGQNANRQPILHEALEQDRVVHPKLPVHALSTTLTSKGGASL
jgi:hypothetical protein